jgi:hypothetical protein
VLSSNEFLAWKEFMFMGRAFQGERFKITVSVALLLPGNFDDVNTIRACPRARKSGRQGAARG